MFKDTLESLTTMEDGRIRIYVKTTPTMGKFFVLTREAAAQLAMDLPSLLESGGTREYKHSLVRDS